MKTIFTVILFTIIASFSWADDWESYQLVQELLNLPGPGAPKIFEDSVIFTASSGFRNVGVAFAHENCSQIYWFKKLMVPQEQNPLFGAPSPPPGKLFLDPYKDSGMLFHVFQVPDNVKVLEYRLVINGLWTVDPQNPNMRKDPISGLIWSILPIPQRAQAHDPLKGLPEGLNFSFKGPPGEIVSIGGNFNGWDPFMYELKEAPAGVYSITLPLPPGTYQYVFFHRGERLTDPYNPRRVYARDGSSASEIIVP